MTTKDTPILRVGVDRDAAIRRVAVSPEGRRSPTQPTAADLTALPGGSVVVLEHGGPATGRWCTDRPVAHRDDVVDPVSRRRARGLSDTERAALIEAWAAAADRVRQLGGRPVVGALDDDLLHRAISPLGGGGDGDAFALTILRACAPCELLLTVEDLAPGGLAPTAGLAFAQRAIAESRASLLVATGGTGWLEPLRSRRKGGRTDAHGVELASAAWCVGRVPVPVWGFVRGDVALERLRASATRLGLAGVWCDERGQPGSP